MKLTKSQIGGGLISIATIALIANALKNFDFTALQYVLLVPAMTVLLQTLIAKTTKETESVKELSREPKVAVVIPAYNEEAVIEETVRANVETIDYDNYSLWVIEDGSTDGTKAIVEGLEAEGLCKVHYRPNNPAEAKADALNDLAINVLDDSYEFICILDADGHLAADYLTKAMAKFEANPNLAGTQATVRIRNNKGFFGRNADTEFINYVSILKSKANHNILGGNSETVRLDLFRKYSPRCVSTVEDMELAEILKMEGYDISAVCDSTVSQEAVTGFGNYNRQRSRWASGNMSVLFENFGKIIKSKKMSLRAKISDIAYLSLNFYVPFVGVAFGAFIVNLISGLTTGNFVFNFNAPLLVALVDFIGIYPLMILNNLRKKSVFQVLFEMISFTAYGFLAIPYYLTAMKRLICNDNSWGKTPRVAELE